ncbi:S53 family peptidase [Lentilactobacillus rapi]|uniref:S53 family peptidase n=1 Tax=Lentilactobacillus rapi TaxID=481723 RepID=UPI0007052099|nr:S53 family peptidase [Lentilactobacillus rapi]
MIHRQKRVIILRGKQLIVALLGSLTVVGVTMAANVKPVNAATKKTIVNVTFKPTSQSELTDYVYNTVDPTSRDFHHYLTPTEFAAKFGQSDSYIQSFKDYLAKYHVQTKTYPGNLSLKLTATEANMRKAFNAKYVAPAKKGDYARASYKLPGKLSDQVVAVIGLYGKSPAKKTKKASSKSSQKAISSQQTALTADLPTTTTKPDTQLTGNAFSKKYGAAKFANAYQLNDLYNKGLQGQGQRIGIISYSDVRDSDLTTYWQQAGVNDNLSRIHRIYTVNTQTQAQQTLNEMLGGLQTEATVDVQAASSVAPQADIDLYVDDSNGTKTSDASSHYASFMTAIGDNQDKQISTSFSPDLEVAADWGDPSASIKQYSDAFNVMLEQAAAQGITVFRSSGDGGRTESPSAKENHGMSTSPYQVLVGGTTLPYEKIINQKVISVPTERAWGNVDATSATNLKYGIFGASGGGFSALNPTPRYQQGVSGVNTFRAINYLTFKKFKFVVNPHPHLIFGTANARNIPDISGNADVQTGYASFVSGKDMTVKMVGKKRTVVKVPTKKWMIGGGTSYTAPQMAGANAIMNSGRQTPIGFWNPQIYKFAQESDSPFTTLDGADNNNLYYTGQPGKLYNQATGLGTINFEKLYGKFDY